MTPEDVRLAVAFAERELQLMQETAAPATALLQRAADGDQLDTRRADHCYRRNSGDYR
jgi:hypothetical protein